MKSSQACFFQLKPKSKELGSGGGGDGLGLLPWPDIDFNQFGETESEQLTKIKKLTGANLHRNWVKIPHVTQWEDVDVTELEALRKKLNESEKKNESIQSHLDAAAYSSFELGENYLSIESDDLSIVVAIKTGAIVETRLKKYPVENIKGALGFRVLGESKDSAFSYYFKSGFTGVSPNYELVDFGVDFVELVDDSLGVSKKISFLEAPYEISIFDSVVDGVQGKSFAGLYRTEGVALDLKRDALGITTYFKSDELGSVIRQLLSEPKKLISIFSESRVESISWR